MFDFRSISLVRLGSRGSGFRGLGLVATVLVVVVGLVFGGVGVPVARAVDITFDGLQGGLSGCAVDARFGLNADIAGGGRLVYDCVGRSATVDLAGHSLDVYGVWVKAGTLVIADSTGRGQLVATTTGNGNAGVEVPVGATLNITGGTITATGSRSAAGIGGGANISGGTVNISGGTVTATGTAGGAGIGGGAGADGGTVNISGGTVTVTGGGFAAGIGGGGGGASASGVVNISGGTVTVRGGGSAAAIGGGFGVNGGAVSISGGVVRVYAGTGSSGTTIGGGGFNSGSRATSFGSLVLGGTLYLMSGSLNVPDSNPSGPEVTITGTGLLTSEGSAAGVQVVTGAGQIANGGTITQTDVTGVTVTDHNYLLSFDPQDGDPAQTVRLYSNQMRAGNRALPLLPVGKTWNTRADGNGTTFLDTTTVTRDLNLYAASVPTTTTPVPTTATPVPTTSTTAIRTFAGLQGGLSGCVEGARFGLNADVVAVGAGEPRLVYDCAGKTATVDLAGHRLEVHGVHVKAGVLTIADSVGGGQLTAVTPGDGHAGIEVLVRATVTITGGTVNAYGGGNSAGIGGGYRGNGGTVNISGGTVTVTGASAAAGIGSGLDGGSGTVNISGGTVTAFGGYQSAAIGAGLDGDSGTVNISGGTVNAYGGYQGSGIGSGFRVNGGAVSISGGVVRVYAGASGGTAIGGGGVYPGSRPTSFGSLVLGGTLYLMWGSLNVPDSNPSGPEVTITGTGLLSSEGSATGVHMITGAGQIVNGGTITQTDVTGVTVTDHNYLLSFNPQDGSPVQTVRLYSDQMRTGNRALPALPVSKTWNTKADGTGTTFLDTTTVTKDLTLYAPTPAPTTPATTVGATPVPTTSTLVPGETTPVPTTTTIVPVPTPTGSGCLVPGGYDSVVVGRFAGVDRYETAVLAARRAFPGTACVVVLASGQSFPDGLSVGSYAGTRNGSLLLTPRHGLPDVVAGEIVRSVGGVVGARVVVVGGVASVSDTVFDRVRELVPGVDVSRLAGVDRYETSRLVGEAGFTSPEDVFVVTGSGFLDALATGGVAARLSAPVLLVRGGDSVLDRDTVELLVRWAPKRVHVVGGVSSVTQGIYDQLQSYASEGVDRVGGVSRYETAVELNKLVYPGAVHGFLVSGEGYPDALVSGVVGSRAGGPVYLTRKSCVPGNVLTALQDKGVTRLTLFGGITALSTAIETKTPCP